MIDRAIPAAALAKAAYDTACDMEPHVSELSSIGCAIEALAESLNGPGAGAIINQINYLEVAIRKIDVHRSSICADLYPLTGYVPGKKLGVAEG